MAAPDTTTVRLRRSDAAIVTALAKHRNTTIVEVLHDAIDALQRQEFLLGLNDDIENMSPALREQLDNEQRLWDSLS